MNKKEISEIKKQFTPANCAITRICGCYVDGEKNKKTAGYAAIIALCAFLGGLAGGAAAGAVMAVL